jgi:UDP-N-acetylmuramoylalanine--D-glutamate ligase
MSFSSLASLRGKRVVVIGLGASGAAAAELAVCYGANVMGTDSASETKLGETVARLRTQGVTLTLGGHEGVAFGDADLIVISPGVPSFPALAEAVARGVPVISEIELASWSFGDVPVIAITGSNGKSTTTTLVDALLRAAGLRVFVGGNLGDPPTRVAPRSADERIPFDTIVLEISSFQAERIPTFRPTVAALLNVSANHLDRYASFDDYVRAKGNLFRNQEKSDDAVVPIAEPDCLREAKRGRGALRLFGSDVRADYGVEPDAIHDRVRARCFSRNRIRLVGEHNMQNIAAALAMVHRFALSEEVIAEVLATFEGLPHRLAFVREVGGVRFYDDSKATSVGAAVAAISGLPEEKVVLIAGGRDKLGSYDPLAHALALRGRGVVLIGEAKERIADALPASLARVDADTMQDAVTKARDLAKPGDAVLLSPACSSFDMFRDYKHRGESFVEAVIALR